MPVDPWQPPQSFDEYRLLRPLGRGRGGLVFLAHDTLLDRHVALKFIPSLSDDAMCMFLVEARAAARIQHPNVAALYRVGTVEGRPFLVSELVIGESLDHLGHAPGYGELYRIALDLARGLAAAHRRGVLHRDIKPGNAILSASGEAKLLDFGLARIVDEEEPVAERFADGTGIGVDPSQPDATRDASFPDLTREEERALRGEYSGKLLGTPYFMSPEAWRREPATVRSDLYSLGVLLYELASGAGPFRRVPVARLPATVLGTDPPPLAAVAPAVPVGLAEIIDRCIRRDPTERFASADELVAALERLRPSRPAAPTPAGNPYRGLRSFEPEHRDLFFGRGRALGRALDRLRGEPFLLVTGDSGVGKSSLAAAGLLPAVADGGLEDARRWTIARMVPGRAPIDALAHALAGAVGTTAIALAHLIRDEPSELPRALRRGVGDTGGALLYVDQLEELVTLAPPGEAERVAQAIGGLAAGVAGVRVVATCRSDFLSRLEALPGLRDRVSRALFLLAPLARDEIREAIVGPAALVDTRFDDDIVDHLVDSTDGAGGAMPLLSFALAELWERREPDGLIPSGALRAIGGLAGALSRHADGLLSTLSIEQRAAARSILLRLVTVERTRARRTADELGARAEIVRAALDALIAGRLVVANETPDGSLYEISHEVLLSGWATLAGWLAEDADRRAAHHRVTLAATEWRRGGRAHGLLWSRRQLAAAAGFAADELDDDERAFLAASTRAAARARWLWRAAALTAVTAIGAAWLGARAAARRDRAREIDRLLADARDRPTAARALDAELARARAAAFRAFDDGRLAEGEKAWAAALSQRPAVLTGYRAASEAIERALLLDPGRADARRLYGDLLFERAAVADREHALELRDELVRRLELYDPDGRLRAAWHAPARIAIASQPSGAHVRVRRYQPGGDRLTLVDGPSGTAPLELNLSPGSHLVELSLAGHVDVAYPILVGRGEARAVAVPLLPVAAVPADFVWVPPGRTLIGSGADEPVRAFFNAVPEHAVEGGGYLIARHETTFGEWIRFLESLPPAERAERAPNAGTGGAKGSTVELARVDGAWQLALKPGGELLRARQGERLRYPERTSRVEQDWTRMPVVGVSFDDAAAYAAWLDRSGVVPGARLCSEEEWERAARGADQRAFPHGDAMRPSDANFDETHGKRPGGFGPDEVGAYPASRSPFGVDDLAGNVWEWTSSRLAPGGAAARGGSFYYAASTARIANRELPERTYRDVSLGLRVCATAGGPDSLKIPH